MRPPESFPWVARSADPPVEWLAELSTSSTTLRVELGSSTRELSVAERDGVRCLVHGVLYGLPDGTAAGPGTDAERVLDAYLTVGDGFVSSLKGFFGVVIADSRRRKLLAVRDPLGVYPIFHAESAGSFLLSPSIRTLQRDSRVGDAVNRAALADHLRHLWPRPTETYFQAITRVPPGHVLSVTGGSATASRYWDPLFPGRRPEWVSEADLGQFDVLLDESIQRLLTLGPTGIYLSGGLDSVAVGALAADLAKRDSQPSPLALSVVFPEPYSEKLTQQGVAGQLGLPQMFTNLDDVLGPSGLVRAAVGSGGLSAPIQNPWLPAYQSLAGTAAGQGRRLILTGSGGDEWLTVTPMYAADLLRAGRLGELVRLARAQSRSYDVSPFLLARNMAWRFGARPMLARETEVALRRLAPERLLDRRRANRLAALDNRPWLAPDPELRRELLARDDEYVVDHAADDDLLPIGGPHSYFRECRQALTHPLVSMEAEEVFEYSGDAGVRVLHPYGDTRLVEFLHATPPGLLNSGGRSKGLIRAMLGRRFPTLGFERQRKTITASYFGRSVMAQAPGMWREIGGAQALADAGIVDIRRCDELYATAEQPRAAGSTAPDHNLTDPIWELLTLESWLRAHQ